MTWYIAATAGKFICSMALVALVLDYVWDVLHEDWRGG